MNCFMKLSRNLNEFTIRNIIEHFFFLVVHYEI